MDFIISIVYRPSLSIPLSKLSLFVRGKFLSYFYKPRGAVRFYTICVETKSTLKHPDTIEFIHKLCALLEVCGTMKNSQSDNFCEWK